MVKVRRKRDGKILHVGKNTAKDTSRYEPVRRAGFANEQEFTDKKKTTTSRSSGRERKRKREEKFGKDETFTSERAGTASRNRRSETKQKPEEIVLNQPEEIVLNQPKKERGFFENVGRFLSGEEVGGVETGIGATAPYTDPKTGITSEVEVHQGRVELGGNLGTIAGKGADIFKGGDAAVNQIVSTVRSDMGGGVLGTFQLNAANAGANAAIKTAETTTTAAARIGTPTVSKVGEMAINEKTIGLAQRFLAKFFTKTTTSINQMTGVKTVTTSASVGGYATKLVWWASSVFLGRWGQAEAPEGVLIPLRDLMETAKTAEDWEVVDQHLQVAEEIADTSIWEEIVLWSPFAALVGIFNKIRGMAEGVEIMKETGVAIREEQMREEAQGGSDFDVAQRERDAARDKRDKEFKQSEKERIERQDERDEEFKQSEKERGEAEEREARIKQEVWRLRRDKKYDEADALELTIYE